MRIDVLTLFPEFFEAPLRASLLGKAIEQGLLEVSVTNVRDFAADRHRTVDDAPYGGGPGMVMRCEPIAAAIESLAGRNSLRRVALMSPRGRRLDQELVRELAAEPDLVLVCARYEGVDERVSTALCTEEISIGDYVLSGGELPALVIIEAISRMVPGVVGDWESVTTDSFYESLLGPPQYTRPPIFRGIGAPMVLREGNHAAIQRWRRKEALRVTRARRPDLLKLCSEEDRLLLEEIDREEAERKRGEQP
ncbi:MAG TPA: tRNA (guanosine(37)-N1)-methyltransferase TrmD [Candidatus Hydrogenedentes bacterium]|nr:tRNA (guanosine(37)-N1)-methyltransferase TrmD [Candidatus Hydrogenedentota bacterium]HQH51458.1 tRNA (guanosine(37)-N1)-methyltransferase TrmD [Candidatus Hydrogenedentota bacterium]HQM47956.1 tRNA (guanosine(37)-N1)-methyltransferase TrmD [Candidatus Hydrogenedentota bacterium]